MDAGNIIALLVGLGGIAVALYALKYSPVMATRLALEVQDRRARGERVLDLHREYIRIRASDWNVPELCLFWGMVAHLWERDLLDKELGRAVLIPNWAVDSMEIAENTDMNERLRHSANPSAPPSQDVLHWERASRVLDDESRRYGARLSVGLDPTGAD